jgi:hypothetical protein
MIARSMVAVRSFFSFALSTRFPPRFLVPAVPVEVADLDAVNVVSAYDASASVNAVFSLAAAASAWAAAARAASSLAAMRAASASARLRSSSSGSEGREWEDETQ